MSYSVIDGLLLYFPFIANISNAIMCNQNAQIQRYIYTKCTVHRRVHYANYVLNSSAKPKKDLNNNCVQSVIKKKTRITMRMRTANRTTRIKVSNAQCATLAEASMSTRHECETLAWCQTHLAAVVSGCCSCLWRFWRLWRCRWWRLVRFVQSKFRSLVFHSRVFSAPSVRHNLVIPRCRLSTYGTRAVSVAGPVCWNALFKVITPFFWLF